MEQELWEQVKNQISKKEAVNVTSFNQWIKPLKLHDVDENNSIIYLRSDETKELFVNIVRKRFLGMITSEFKEITGKDYQIIVKLAGEYQEKEDLISENSKIEKQLERSRIGLGNQRISNPMFTFENFVVGDCNKFAYAASLAVAESPSQGYNPLFVYGGSGLGKTHLINAIANYLIERDVENKMNILYVSNEMFMNELINAFSKKTMQAFKEKYRSLNVFIIDDIQFLKGDRVTEEFFNTFNDLTKNDCQIVISSDRPPNELDNLDERLKSRFASSLFVNLDPPDYETRVAILQKKAENANIEVDENIYEVICLIADNITDNIRTLTGAFENVIHLSKIMKVDIDISFAKSILKDTIRSGEDNITPSKIKSVVCRHYKIKVSQMESNTRLQSIAYPRQIAMYLCRNMTDYSYEKIGEFFGDRHYSTVMHACDKIQKDINKKELDIKVIEDIKKRIIEG